MHLKTELKRKDNEAKERLTGYRLKFKKWIDLKLVVLVSLEVSGLKSKYEKKNTVFVDLEKEFDNVKCVKCKLLKKTRAYGHEIKVTNDGNGKVKI